MYAFPRTMQTPASEISLHVSVAAQALEMIGEHPNAIVREQYAGRMAAILDLPQQTLLAGQGARRAPARRPDRTERSERPSLMVLRLAVHDPDSVAPYLDEALFVDEVELTAYRALFTRGGLQGGETVLSFTNNHLGYAITWFGFAAIVPALLFFWVRRQRMPVGAQP